MGKSLEARFNGNSPEAVQYAKDFGISKFMEYYEIKTYTSALDFLEKAEPGYAFKMVKKNDPDYLTSYESARNTWLVILESLHHSRAENANLRLQLAEAKREVDYFKAQHRNESTGIVQAILKECQEGGH